MSHEPQPAWGASPGWLHNAIEAGSRPEKELVLAWAIYNAPTAELRSEAALALADLILGQAESLSPGPSAEPSPRVRLIAGQPQPERNT